jgi:uncharacterized protein
MKPEIFFLPRGDNHILYAPLIKFVAEVNASAKNAVARRLQGLDVAENQRAAIKELDERGVFSEDFHVPRVNRPFCPTRVTLFPTDRCNLRCRYCYASAAAGGHKLSIAAAKAAIDMIARNAKNQGLNAFSVGFHGNGEPFEGFDVIRACCEYANEVSERTGLKCFVSAATNGVLSEDRLDYLIAWITDVNVSFDILPEIQNANRPTASGAESFRIVDGTLRRLNAARVQFGIRSTITSTGVYRMKEMAAFVAENYPRCNLLHFEPVFEVGRAVVNNETAPDPRTFVREYAKAQEVLKDTSIRLVYSGARADALCSCFCGVCGNSFTVTAEGNVTACYEICTYGDSRAERYIYGKFDDEARAFVFDEDKLNALSGLQVENIPHCKDCFAKWHCGGDCLAKTLGTKSPEEHAGSPRCVVARALIYRQILQKMGEDLSGTEPMFL